MSADVCCRLQGIQASSLKKPPTDRDLRRLMGNSMCLAVVEPLLRSALVSVGCCDDSVPNRWESGVAQAGLLYEAWGARLTDQLLSKLSQRVLRHLAAPSPLSSVRGTPPGHDAVDASASANPSAAQPSTGRSASGTFRAPGSCRFDTEAEVQPRDCWISASFHDIAELTTEFLAGCHTGVSDNVEHPSTQRQRDVFPLPSRFDLALDNSDALTHTDVLTLATATVNGLNFLYGTATPQSSRLLACQRSVLRIVFDKAWRMHARLAGIDSHDSGTEALDKVIGSLTADGSKSGPKLVAADCDLLPRAGLVDPLRYLSQEHRNIVTNDEKLFPSPVAGLEHFANIKGADRGEYVRLVVRQLRTGKVELRRNIKAGGTVFGVAKKGSTKVREVWDGSRVSDVCIPPPPPPMLATPCSFPRLEVKPGRTLLLSKKDCRCFFDQLALPRAVQPWTGRPPVRFDELLGVDGMSRDELLGLLSSGKHRRDASSSCARIRGADVFYPVSRVWCMGFAWSSFIAQSTLLACCRAAGFRDRMCLCDGNPAPDVDDEAYALATDDVMHFTTGGVSISESRMSALDEA